MPSRQAAPTILDVAAAAGVSVTTVSRVLNGKGDVAPATAERVRTVIGQLGYESSLAARSLRGRRSQVICLIVPDMDHAYVVEIIRGVSRAVAGTGYDLIAMTTGSKSHLDRGRWEQQQISRINGTIADGVIVVAPDAREFRTAFPLVAVDPYWHTEAYPSVIGDNRSGAQAVMDHLIGLGHRRIGFIGGNEYLSSAEQRRIVYGRALAKAGITFDPALAVEGNFTREAGVAGANALLRLQEPPTAVFAANDDTAFGVLDVARARGVRVPEDLSVAGFDNVPDSQTSLPPLTTVDQQIGLVGELAVRMLLDLVGGKTLEQQHITVPTKLVLRGSTGPPRAGPALSAARPRARRVAT